MMGSDLNLPDCNTAVQLSTLMNLTYGFRKMSENDIYAVTGCLSSCNKVNDLLSV